MSATMAVVAVLSSLGGAAGMLGLTVILESRLAAAVPSEVAATRSEAPARVGSTGL